MVYRRLWILIEGNDEKRFFETRKHIFEDKYDFIQTWQYAGEPPKRIKNFLKSITAMNSDYFFLRDINDFPCVTARMESIKDKYGTRIDTNNIIIVVKEIESWYLAGLDDKARKELGIRTFSNTDTITKEEFNNLIPERFDSQIDFMVEILKRFSVETAKQKNRSFNHFMSRV
ncbi:MAG: hypothetical protein IIB56_00745 [Planctomycetes bacterium]|nr:hypothetical protein [Planctomycetota bacterium]MCH8118598.1 hypothetical protein [Planctomycetota bacterium]